MKESTKRTMRKKQRRWKRFARFVLLLEILAMAVVLARLASLKILPAKYLLVVTVVFVLLVIISALLLFAGKRRSGGRTFRRVLAVILAAVVCFAAVFGTRVLDKFGSTLNKVTENDNTLEAKIGVYVLKDSGYEELSDLLNGTYGTLSRIDLDNTAKAVQEISSEVGADILTEPYASFREQTAALYDHSADALILNEAYVDLVSELFTDFPDTTKLIYEVEIRRDQTGNAPDPNAVSDITEDPFLVYISGSDTRSQILDVSRSDVNILMAVNPKTHQILLLNTPRDYYVANPAGGDALDKLTHLGIYGVENSMNGLSQLYDEKINYYAQINFTGFEKLIDAIGGITVDSDVAFSDGTYNFTAGPNQMDGKKALAFARDRYHQVDGDNARGRHQMMVIEAVIRKLTSDTSVLMNYSSILDSLSGMVVTSLTSDDLSSLVRAQLDDPTAWNVKRYAVTGQGGSSTTYSMPDSYAYVMYQDEAMVQKASGLIDKVMNGETLIDTDLQ